jgi:diguanylate cyclase (GGDEF)-like protein
MIVRRRIDVALASGTVALALVVAIAGADSGAAWVRWLLVVATAAVLLRVLLAGSPRSEPAETEAEPDDIGMLDAAIESEVRRCRRTGRPMSVVLCEIDRFDELEAKHGAEARQAADRQVAELLRSSAREIDVLARMSDGTYGILLPETPDHGAALVADRLRTAISRWSPQGGVALTASFGVAGWIDELDVLAEAWDALAEARAQGRDCVVVAGDGDMAS